MPGSTSEVNSEIKKLEVSPSKSQPSSKIYKNSATIGGGDSGGGKTRKPSKRQMRESGSY